jgi:hypothetical protein
MAIKYWVSKAPGGWSGSRGAGTESSPYDGALGVRTAIAAGDIAPNDTVIFMGEYGPVLHAEILADFPNTAVAINAAISQPSFGATNWLITSGGIVWGDRYDGSSKCRDITFLWRGDIPWHIDARGATTNAGRMRAALCIQGVRNTVDGLRIAAPDWNWIDTTRGAGQFLPSTGVVYPAESSFENHGLVMQGAWGCQVRNSTCWGSNAFGQIALYIRHAHFDTTSQPDSQTIVEDNYCYGSYTGIYCGIDNNNINGGLAFPARTTPAAGANLYVRNNIVTGCRWGDRATTPVINNAMYHAGPIAVQTSSWLKGNCWVYGNTVSGDCQDGIEAQASNVHIFENIIQDINPLYPGSTTFDRWYDNAGTWAVTSLAAINSSIKLGLTGSDGSVPTSPWPSLGTAGGSFLLPAFRNYAYRNIIRRVNGDGSAITANGSNGMVVANNEISDAYGISLGGIDGSATRSHWCANNYVQSKGAAITVGNASTTFLYNNIANGATVDITAPTAPATIYGGNNRLVNNTTFFTGSTNNMRANTTGAAAYTVGVGPTAGGNCADTGSWEGIFGAKCTAVLRDLTGSAYRGTVPVGPRKP